VLYAGSAMYGALDIQQSSPYIDHCHIEHSSWSGINFNGDSLAVDFSVIKNCAARGIIYTGGHFRMRNDTFVSNVQGAIHVEQMYDGMQSYILDSYFAQNYHALSWQNSGLERVTIRNNVFTGHTNIVVSLRGHYDTVTCNQFINNTGAEALHWGDGGNPVSGGIIYNNLFQGNFNANGASVMHIGAGYYSGGGDTLVIANNIVRNNSSPGHACCVFEADLFSIIPGPYLRIRDNVFESNSGAQFMRIFGAQTNNPSYNFLRIQNNTFNNPNCQYELYNSVPYGSPNLSVGNNYWGSTSTTYVEGVIYDYFDFANQSVVYYSPILAAPIVIDTTCQDYIEHPDGINENTMPENAFLVYPNPSGGTFSITSGDASQWFEGELEIFNALSQKVYSASVSGFSVNNVVLPDEAGVYFISITTADKKWTGRIVRE
jgi:hypothetical protein